MKFNKKGQAALEFLTTYGWAFLVILVAIGGLSYFGVFDFTRYIPEACKMDGTLACADTFQISATTNTVSLALRNNAQKRITITGISVMEKSLKDSGVTTFCIMANPATDIRDLGTGTNDEISPGMTAEKEFTLTNAPDCGLDDALGTKKTFNFDITYELQGSNIPQVASGTVSSTVI